MTFSRGLSSVKRQWSVSYVQSRQYEYNVGYLTA